MELQKSKNETEDTPTTDKTKSVIIPAIAKSTISLHSDNSDASSDAKAKSRTQKQAESIEKAKGLNEDFVYAIEECVELNSDDYEKEQIHFVKNVYLPHE